MTKFFSLSIIAAATLALASCDSPSDVLNSVASDGSNQMATTISAQAGDPYATINDNLGKKYDKAFAGVNTSGSGPFERSARVCDDPQRNSLCMVITAKSDTTFGQLLQPVNRNRHMLEAMHLANDWKPNEVSFNYPIAAGTTLAFSFGRMT